MKRKTSKSLSKPHEDRYPDHSSEESDRLVVLAGIGDAEAFEELVKRHQSRLRNLLRRLSNDTALADDLAQQTFLEAWRKH